MTLPGESMIDLFDNVLERFCRKFLREDYINLKRNIGQDGFLLWNNKFKVKLKLIPTSDFTSIVIDRNRKVYCYFEREQDLRKCKLYELEIFLEKLDPWEYADIDIFDETFEWTIIVTHEDCTLLYGVNLT